MSKQPKKLVPKLRFTEFQDSGEWGLKRFGDISKVVASGDLDINLFSPTKTSTHIIPVYSNAIDKDGLYGYYLTSKYPKNSISITARGNLGHAFHRTTAFMGIGRLIVAYDFKNDVPSFVNECWNYLVPIPQEVTSIPQLTAVAAKAKLLPLPTPLEQQKISDCLSSIDELITAQTQKIAALKDHKKGLMQQLFPREGETIPKLRFSEFQDAGDWEEKTLDESLDYQQPTSYLVSDTNYSNAFETPVLTAGKTFILGYTNEQNGIFSVNLPVIIFDDFTTATQFVDFPFKAKSSAMKILLAKNGANIKFMYELIQMIGYEVGTHERHWISKFAPMLVLMPSSDEQKKIADFLSSIDEIIAVQTQQLESYKTHKKGLMQQLFLNMDEVSE